MEKLNYKLEVFEGPMDLLLHLITKHKLDIYDIPILELVEQYTSYVREMQEENMEVASEFLEMAARLVYIKTVSLLPVYDEAEDLKNELRDELLEYRDCKILAGKLAQMTDGFNYTARGFQESVSPDNTYKRLHEPSELLNAYSLAAGKKLRRLPPPIDSFKTIVTKKQNPVLIWLPPSLLYWNLLKIKLFTFPVTEMTLKLRFWKEWKTLDRE